MAHRLAVGPVAIPVAGLVDHVIQGVSAGEIVVVVINSAPMPILYFIGVFTRCIVKNGIIKGIQQTILL